MSHHTPPEVELRGEPSLTGIAALATLVVNRVLVEDQAQCDPAGDRQQKKLGKARDAAWHYGL